MGGFSDVVRTVRYDLSAARDTTLFGKGVVILLLDMQLWSGHLRYGEREECAFDFHIFYFLIDISSLLLVSVQVRKSLAVIQSVGDKFETLLKLGNMKFANSP